MIDLLIDFAGVVVLALLGLTMLCAVSKVFAIAQDTRTMVVLLRRVLDITVDYGTREEDNNVEG